MQFLLIRITLDYSHLFQSKYYPTKEVKKQVEESCYLVHPASKSLITIRVGTRPHLYIKRITITFKKIIKSVKAIQ